MIFTSRCRIWIANASWMNGQQRTTNGMGMGHTAKTPFQLHKPRKPSESQDFLLTSLDPTHAGQTLTRYFAPARITGKPMGSSFGRKTAVLRALQILRQNRSSGDSRPSCTVQPSAIQITLGEQRWKETKPRP